MRGLAAIVTLGIVASPAGAQLPSASAADLALGDNVTALARGFSAVASNPAGLAMPGNPGFSLAAVPVRLSQGLDPVTLGDLADWDGRVIPPGVKEAWLQDVEAEGGQSGESHGAVSALSLQVGRFGFQLSTVGVGRGHLPPDAVELMLFGNAGRTGEPRDFDLAGSRLDGFVVSTAAVAFGHPVADVAGGRMAVGATLSYSMGHALVLGRDLGSSVGSDPVEVELRFPLLSSDPDADRLDNGSGFGLDLGLAWARDDLRMGVSVRNVMNTFAWDVDDLVFRRGTALFNKDDSDSDFDERPAAEAPQELRRAVEEMGFEPVLAVGAALEAHPRVTVSADVRNRFGDGMAAEPKFQAGLGVEGRPAPWIPLRAHVAKITDGYQVGGGLSLVLGPVSLSGALAARMGDVEDATLGMLTLSWGAR